MALRSTESLVWATCAATIAVAGAGLPAASLLMAQGTTSSTVARFDTGIVAESSALQHSRTQPGVFWTLSDSSNPTTLYALDRDGELLQSFDVVDVENRDWEALALDDEGYLYVGDVGNNRNRRDDLVVYRVREPKIGSAERELSVDRRMPFEYEEQEGPPPESPWDFDSEAIFWAQSRLYLLTKERTSLGTALYRFEPPVDGETEWSLEKLSHFDMSEDIVRRGAGTVTGADASEDGSHLAVLGYRVIYVFERPEDSDDYLSNRPVLRIVLERSATKQCEGIAWHGDDLVLSNEQGELHRIVAPLRTRPTSYPAAD